MGDDDDSACGRHESVGLVLIAEEAAAAAVAFAESARTEGRGV